MGVHGLWDLLAPVGRRVSVETLSGQKLAIDASIWMVQFMKAMRDEKGEMVRNAHLLGFFRRICKLLYLRTKPVFVFDGATPALKRLTVIARRRQRENAQAKIRKTAEKLLLNHLKSLRLKELAKDLANQRKRQKGDDAKGKNISSDQAYAEKGKTEDNHDDVETYDQEKLDEMLAASVAAGEGWNFNKNASAFAAGMEKLEDDEDKNEEIILDIRNQNMANGNSAKVKKDMIDLTDMEQDNLPRDDLLAELNQEKLDEMFAASIVADECRNFTKTASTSAAAASASAVLFEEEGNDDDEEMILPEMCGKVDPAVLAALPPSMQLDLLVQMRERLMAENRQKYQKVKKAPEKFSDLQIEAYLKTVAFRREINEVQKAAAGNGVGGVQSSRIASEANREFIFSSSFTGDKRLLTSTGVQKNGQKQQQTPTRNPFSDSEDCVASTSKSNATAELVPDDTESEFDEDVETYVDERGQIRVSRVRAMGMRMTRDLQRNLDLMKEIEQERRRHANNTASGQSELSRNKTGSPLSIPSEKLHLEKSHDKSCDSIKFKERSPLSVVNNEDSMQISFQVDQKSKNFDSDDDLFASLVAGQPLKADSADNVISRKQASDSASDSDWEEGIVERSDNSFDDLALQANPSLKGSHISEGAGVECEDEHVHLESPFSFGAGKSASKGYMEEEADLQEAIRRSLEDLGGEKPRNALCKHENLKISEPNACEDFRSLDQEHAIAGVILPEKDVSQNGKSVSELLATRKTDRVDQIDTSQFSFSSHDPLNLSKENNPDNLAILEGDLGSGDELRSQNTNSGSAACREMLSAESLAMLHADKACAVVEQSSSASVQSMGLSTSTEKQSEIFLGPGAIYGNLPFDTSSMDDERNKMEAEPSILVKEDEKTNSASHFGEITNSSKSTVDPPMDSTMMMDAEPKLDGGRSSNYQLNEQWQEPDNINKENLQADLSEATLQEEILILGQESMDLGNEQKMLERNAESVSSEMFAECQELLQIFGLPYIIAPMEAEAQCAYMELENLVDGVVTDDSDVFLFGARNVYKNIFDDRKYVETYFMKDIEKELGLTREKLIRMALLLGSDYTEGISGIGIVNAVEVVNAFPEEDGLKKFREWIESPDPTILGKYEVQNGTESKHSNSDSARNNMGDDASHENIPEGRKEENIADHIHKIRKTFMDKHRNVSKNWHVPSSFPSEAVISAYLCPQVDKSTEPFTWGKPDLHVLRRLCWEKFAWPIQKSDGLLLPVLREYDKHETQLRLEAFYTFNERFAKIRSKRIRQALKGITRHQSSELTLEDDEKELSKSSKKRTIRPAKSGEPNTDAPSKRPKNSMSVEAVEVDNPRKKKYVEDSLCSGKEQCGSRRGRGRGRGRGRRKESEIELSNSSNDFVSGGEDEHEIHIRKSEELLEPRRSKRSRKAVNYVVDDFEIDVDISSDQRDKCFANVVEPGKLGVVGESTSASIGSCVAEQCKVNDPLREDLAEGPLGMEDEDSAGDNRSSKAVASQNNYARADSMSKEYLKMGGGFCTDEDDSNSSGVLEESGKGESLVQPIPSFGRTLSDAHEGERTNTCDIEQCVDATDHFIEPENIETERVVSKLSAMPSLKRKRRKK